MSDNKHFDQLVASGKPVGEVIAVDRFMIKVRGLQPCNLHALVMFEDGSKGYIHNIFEDHVVILHLGTKNVKVGMTAVIQYEKLVAKVSEPAPPVVPEVIDPNMRAAIQEMERVLGTRVRIVEGADGKGRLEIEYYSPDDLERIYNHILR